MMPVLLTLVTVLAWGTWLLPAQGITTPSAVVVLHATAANLIVATLAAQLIPSAPAAEVTPALAVAIALGGGAWALSGVCAFRATALLGPGRAMGIWSPLNIIVSLVWGAWWFGEFHQASPARLALSALAVMILLGGLRLLLRSDPNAEEPRGGRAGVWWAVGAGVLWGSYFVPLRASGTSTWQASLPLAVGTFATAVLIVLLRRDSLRLPRTSQHLRLLACGVLWSIGNYGSLLLMEHVGTGRGFSIAQLCLVVNALLGIHLLRTPAPGSPAARRVLLGCAFATAGGVILGLTS